MKRMKPREGTDRDETDWCGPAVLLTVGANTGGLWQPLSRGVFSCNSLSDTLIQGSIGGSSGTGQRGQGELAVGYGASCCSCTCINAGGDRGSAKQMTPGASIGRPRQRSSRDFFAGNPAADVPTLGNTGGSGGTWT